MPPPTCKCAICNKETTKRSTLMVEPYGRICRNHPEVEQYKEKLAALQAQVKENKEANEKLNHAFQSFQVMAMVEQLRVLAAMKDVSMELVILAFGWKIPPSIREEVIKQAREKGPLTAQEMQDSLMTYLLFQQRLKKDQAETPLPDVTPSQHFGGVGDDEK